MCSFELKRKGIVGTTVVGQMLFIGAMFTRVIARAPILVCSIVSFSAPSALLLKTLIVCLPPLSFASVAPICLTASTVG